MAHLEMDPLISRKTWNFGTWQLIIWIQHILLSGRTVTQKKFVEGLATYKFWTIVTRTTSSFSQAAFNFVSRQSIGTDIPLRYIIWQNLGLIHDGFKVPWINFLHLFTKVKKRLRLTIIITLIIPAVNTESFRINFKRNNDGTTSRRGILQEIRIRVSLDTKFNISCLLAQLQMEIISGETFRSTGQSTLSVNINLGQVRNKLISLSELSVPSFFHHSLGKLWHGLSSIFYYSNIFRTCSVPLRIFKYRMHGLNKEQVYNKRQKTPTGGAIGWSKYGSNDERPDVNAFRHYIVAAIAISPNLVTQDELHKLITDAEFVDLNKLQGILNALIRTLRLRIPSWWYTTLNRITSRVTSTRLAPQSLHTLSGEALWTNYLAASETITTIIYGVTPPPWPPPRHAIGNLAASLKVDTDPFQVYHE